MTTLQLAEGAVDAVLAYLSTNLSSHVTAINTQYSDSVTLTAPVTFGNSETVLMPATPAVMVVAEDIKLTENGYNTTRLETRTSIVVIVTDADPNSDTLRTRLYRQILAIARCLMTGFRDPASALLGKLFWNAGPLARYSPVYSNNGQLFADAQFYFEYQQQETTP